MTFFRYSGAGNTFVFADNRSHSIELAQALFLCAKENIDGLILVESAANADAFMRIFNRDGSEAEMCGNGLRCCIHFLKTLGIQRAIYHIETLAGLQKGWFTGDDVCVQLSTPTQLRLHIEHNLHFLNTGVPHAVVFTKKLATTRVEEEGKKLRFSSLFAPAGANINFVCLNSDHSITVRTYERGVEAETQACGTGAAAAALVTHKLFQLPSPIDAQVRSGEKLKISFNDDWSILTLTGPIKSNGSVIPSLR